MPNEIKITILWDQHNISMSTYSVYREELKEIHRIYNLGQLELFTAVGEKNLVRWIDDVFHRHPEKIFIDKVYF